MEQVISLAVFLNYALAVHKAKPATLALGVLSYLVRIKHLGIKYAVHVIGTQSHTGIRYRNLHVIITRQSLNAHLTASGREFACIISKGVYHKERKDAVSAHYSICGSYIQLYTLLAKTAGSTAYYVKQVL